MFSLSVIIFWLLSLCFMSQLLWKYFCCAEEWGVTKSPVLDVKSFSPVHNAPIRRWSLSCGSSFSEHEVWSGFRGSLCHHLAVESEVLDCLICNNRGYGRDEFQIRFQFWNFVIQIDCCTCTCTHTHLQHWGCGVFQLNSHFKNFLSLLFRFTYCLDGCESEPHQFWCHFQHKHFLWLSSSAQMFPHYLEYINLYAFYRPWTASKLHFCFW